MRRACQQPQGSLADLLGERSKRFGRAVCAAMQRARCSTPRAGAFDEKVIGFGKRPLLPPIETSSSSPTPKVVSKATMFALLPLLPAALLAPRLSSPRARVCRCFITAVEPSFDAWSLPALLPNVFTNGGESVVSVERVEVYSEKLGWVTQIRGIEVTPAGVELGLVMFALLVYSRVQRERRGWLPGSGWQARAEEEKKKKGKGR